ncbi:hypothetical protein D3C80_1153490 [compost metagenome]
MIAAIKQVLRKNRITPSVYYWKCNDLPLSIFLKVLLTGDVGLLTISGKPTKEELDEAFQSIHEEYLSLSESVEYKQLLSLIKEIAMYENRYNLIVMAVNILRIIYDERIATELRTYGYKVIEGDVKDPSYHKQLDIILTKSKFIKINLQRASDDLNKINKNESESPDENSYDVLLADLSKHQGYYLDPDKITVTHFLAVLKRYRQFVESKTQKRDD